jgi:hypothetical protein
VFSNACFLVLTGKNALFCIVSLCVVIFRIVTPCNVNFSLVLIFVELINYSLCECMYSFTAKCAQLYVSLWQQHEAVDKKLPLSFLWWKLATTQFCVQNRILNFLNRFCKLSLEVLSSGISVHDMSCSLFFNCLLLNTVLQQCR